MMAFTAGVGWRRQGWDDDNPVADSLAKMWIVFQPLLFSLIGAEIQVTSNFKDHYNFLSTAQVLDMSLSTVGWGCLVLVAGLSTRLLAAFLAVSGGR